MIFWPNLKTLCGDVSEDMKSWRHVWWDDHAESHDFRMQVGAHDTSGTDKEQV